MKFYKTMNLCIDIGNSRTKIALFQENRVVAEHTCEELTKDFLQEIFAKYDVKKSIISSVTHNKREIITFLKKRTDLVELTNETPLSLKINYLTPKTLGRDRIAAAVGAAEILPNSDILIIDIGSCVTMDLVTADGVFHGGNIAPGFLMRINAMHDYTAKLPIVKPQVPYAFLGKSTTEAVLYGAFWGIVSEVNALLDRLLSDCKNISIVLTGGDSHYFKNHLKRCRKVVPNLVLIGLNAILELKDKN